MYCLFNAILFVILLIFFTITAYFSDGTGEFVLGDGELRPEPNL